MLNEKKSFFQFCYHIFNYIGSSITWAIDRVLLRNGRYGKRNQGALVQAINNSHVIF